MTDPNRLEKLRPCGRLETFSTARHHLGFYKNVGFTAEYITSNTSESSLEIQVYSALRHVIAEHPNLSVVPLNEDQSYPKVYFAQLPEIDLHTVVELRERKTSFPKDGETDGELDKLLAEQHSRDFKEGLELGSMPFWRLILLSSPGKTTRFTATWMWHHALADGASALLFHESFLAGLNSTNTASDTGPIVKPPTAALLPPLEGLHPMLISWSYFLSAVLRSIFPSIFSKRPAMLWTGNPVPSSTATIPHPRYRTLVLCAETTKRLAQTSRKEKTSVTSTLQCLLAASLFAILPAEQYKMLKIEGPISMKRWLDVKEKDMTNAITMYSYLHSRRTTSTPNVHDHFSWDEVRAVKSTIMTEVAKEGRDSAIALLKYVSDMPQYFKEKLGKERDPTTEISNVGIWQGNTDEGAKWKVGRMVFSQCPNLVTGAFTVSAVTGGDGNAVLNFCWCEGVIEDAFMEKVIEGVREGVEGLVNS
jgi:hypothetical protein